MNEWVLIIAFFSPGGDFMDKIVFDYATKKECIVARDRVPVKGLYGSQHSLCITKDHWTGKQPMPNVALD